MTCGPRGSVIRSGWTLIDKQGTFTLGMSGTTRQRYVGKRSLYSRTQVSCSVEIYPTLPNHFAVPARARGTRTTTPRVFMSAVLVTTVLKVLRDLMKLLASAKTATNYFSTATSRFQKCISFGLVRINPNDQEINILRNPLEAAASSLPANFGWPCVEGGGIPLPTYNWITQVRS